MFHLIWAVFMGVGSGGQGGVAPWIFKHGTNIVDRGLKVLFCYFLAFFAIFGLFSIDHRLE